MDKTNEMKTKTRKEILSDWRRLADFAEKIARKAKLARAPKSDPVYAVEINAVVNCVMQFAGKDAEDAERNAASWVREIDDGAADAFEFVTTLALAGFGRTGVVQATAVGVVPNPATGTIRHFSVNPDGTVNKGEFKE